MKAFNHRFDPKEWAGLPRAVVAGGLGCLVSFVLLVVMPAWVKVLAAPVLIVCVCFTVYALRLGDDWMFRTVMASSRADNHGVTADTWTRD